MKVTRLSRLKIQLGYNVPVYMKGFDKPLHTIDVLIRYKKDKNTKVYNLIRSSVDRYVENLAFRWKVGDIKQSLSNRYTIKGITPHYTSRFGEIEGVVMDVQLKYILIEDENFISVIRNKKLEDILNGNS
jgi:hypothetical protein